MFKQKLKQKAVASCFIAITTIAFAIVLSSCKLQSVEDYNKTDSKIENGITVTFSVDAHTILDNLDKAADKTVKDIVTEDGILLPVTEVEVEQGSTVLDLIVKASKEHDFQLSYEGSDATAYVNSIYGISDFMVGAGSGWQYSLNDEIVMTACGAQQLNDGDMVAFLYTCDLGSDLKGDK